MSVEQTGEHAELQNTYGLISLADIRGARRRISATSLRTPLVKLDAAIDGAELYIKAESLQPIGSFKLRGAANKIAQITREQLRHGVITYSSGNHAQGVAYAARAAGARAVIVMPSNAPEIKRKATEALALRSSLSAQPAQSGSSGPKPWPPSMATPSFRPMTTSTSSPARLPAAPRSLKICLVSTWCSRP